MRFSRRAAVRIPLLLSTCCAVVWASGAFGRSREEPAHSAELDAMIVQAAKKHNVPEHLVRRVVMRESKYNPAARNHKYWGLMQISYPTAKSMGFKGSPEELLNPLVNLTYAVPYLANAFVVAGKREDAAVRLYASGYYATAKRRGLLTAMRTAVTDPAAITAEAEVAPIAPTQQSSGFFGFGASQPAPAPAPAPVQTAEAAAAVPTAPSQQIAAAAAQAQPSSGMDSGDQVDMVANKKGGLEPPKKWKRDGGMTVIARGEQSVSEIAASKAADADKPQKSARRHSRKTTEFAAIEAPPANAQAYAAMTPEQGARMDQTASQSAIAQATNGQPQPVAQGAPMTEQQAGAMEATAAAAPDAGRATAHSNDKPSRKSRHVKRRSRDRDAETTNVARTAPAPSAAATDGSAAPAHDAQVVASQPQ